MKAACFAAAGPLPATHRCLINKHTLRGDMCVHKAGSTRDVSTFTVRHKTGINTDMQRFRYPSGTCSTHGGIMTNDSLYKYRVGSCPLSGVYWI
jgi:hypothetical protein